MRRLCAVSLHDVRPASLDRCRDIRDWLEARGVDRATLLVIPGARLQSTDGGAPELLVWLERRMRSGDAVAQHGFRHRQYRKPRPPRRWVARLQGGDSAEFAGLDEASTRSALRVGRRIMSTAGLEPRGFVAPAFAYNRTLRAALPQGFDWWAGLLCVHLRDGRPLVAPANGFGSSGPVKRALSPIAAKAGASIPGRLLRIEVHPEDFDDARHVHALEWMLERARQRELVTYDELVGG